MSEENKNPYDLVDNVNQNTSPVVKQDTNSIDQSQDMSNNKEESGQFFKKIIKGIAKMAWLPDPETWKPLKESAEWQTKPEVDSKDSTNADTTLEQDIVAQEWEKPQEQQVEEKKKFSFENVMSGVTWVLDKIEKKVEEKTWIDLDAPLKKREETLANNAWETNTPIAEPEQPIQSTPEQVTNPEVNENPVEKNNDEYLSENH